MKVTPIRPYQFFGLLESEQMATLPIPRRRSGGNLKLLETFVVVAAARIVKASRVFEFGTYRGSTTLALALNTCACCEILTLDLPDLESAGEIHAADAPLAAEHLSMNALDYEGTGLESKIKPLKANSRTFDGYPWKASIDLVLIDGGHDLATVRADTLNAFAMARSDKQSCILWHDYNNPEYPEISTFLNDLSRTESIYHVQETMLCVRFSQPISIL